MKSAYILAILAIAVTAEHEPGVTMEDMMPTEDWETTKEMNNIVDNDKFPYGDFNS